jgi:hypothetical protein
MRPFVLRYKPGDQRADRNDPPLVEHLAKAWAVVTNDSNVAIEALVAGVPAFVTGRHPINALAERDLRLIEVPQRPGGRLEFMAMLAANQWTLEEFAAGVPHLALGLA